jgi:hypothetical protein
MILSTFEDTRVERLENIDTEMDFEDDDMVDEIEIEEDNLGAIFEDTDNEIDLVTDNDFDDDFKIEEMD